MADTGTLNMDETQKNGVVLAADGRPLKQSLARALRRQKLRALMLVAPLLIFVLISFVVPIGNMLTRSFVDTTVTDVMPNTFHSLRDWDPKSGELPSEETYQALAQDLGKSFEDKTHMIVARRLNFENSGITSTIRKSAKKAGQLTPEDAPFKDKFLEMDKGWSDIDLWATIKNYGAKYTPGYYYAAMDAGVTKDGFAFDPPDERIHQKLFLRTVWLSILITVCTIALGYPVAWLMAHLKDRHANLLMILVLLPFWTSLLVRTTSWKVLLQEQGVINQLLVSVGLVSDDNRLELMYNQFGVVLSMTHILLPFMILPLYSVMKTIPPSYLRAAKSLGARNWTAFWRVYFPQTVPGIGAGAILVFILGVGYFITPEIMGGADGTFISNRIYHQFKAIGNWGLAAALGSLMLIAVLLLYWVYDRIVGIDNVKLG